MSQAGQHVAETKKLGFDTCIVPKSLAGDYAAACFIVGHSQILSAAQSRLFETGEFAHVRSNENKCLLRSRLFSFSSYKF